MNSSTPTKTCTSSCPCPACPMPPSPWRTSTATWLTTRPTPEARRSSTSSTSWCETFLFHPFFASQLIVCFLTDFSFPGPRPRRRHLLLLHERPEPLRPHQRGLPHLPADRGQPDQPSPGPLPVLRRPGEQHLQRLQPRLGPVRRPLRPGVHDDGPAWSVCAVLQW